MILRNFWGKYTGGTWFDVNLTKLFWDLALRIVKSQPNIRKRDLINLKTICTAREPLHERKRQLSEWKIYIYANQEITRYSIPGHANSWCIWIKNTYHPREKKWGKGYFLQEGRQIATGHLQRCSASLITGSFPGGSDGKASVYNAEDLGLIPGLGRSAREGNGNPLQYYCLENPIDRGAW